jgi:hypothetical protein
MDLLFGHTSVIGTIKAIWWYCPFDGPAPATDTLVKETGNWHVYILGIPDPYAYLKDGVGYWIKAEKSGTLKLSGVAIENAPFAPHE